VSKSHFSRSNPVFCDTSIVGILMILSRIFTYKLGESRPYDRMGGRVPRRIKEKVLQLYVQGLLRREMAKQVTWGRAL
jgi:hypothetical protein